MKNTYVKPEMQVEEFLANQYVATCGKRPDGTYIFTCDAAAGNVYVKGVHGTYMLGGYHPCGKTHETEGTGNYYDGFVDRNGNGKEDSDESALIWAENGNEYYSNGFLGMGRGWHFSADDWHASASLTPGEVEEVNS